MADSSGTLLSGAIAYEYTDKNAWLGTTMNVNVPANVRALWVCIGGQYTAATAVSIGGVALTHVLNREKYGRRFQIWQKGNITARTNDTLTFAGSSSTPYVGVIALAAGSNVGWRDTDADTGWAVITNRSYTQHDGVTDPQYQIGVFVSGGENAAHNWTPTGATDKVWLGAGGVGNGGCGIALYAAGPTTAAFTYGLTSGGDTGVRFSGGQLTSFTNLPAPAARQHQAIVIAS